MTESRVAYLIQGQPWPADIDPTQPYLVWIQTKGERTPTPEQLRAAFVRRYGYEPEHVIGLGVIAVGPVREEGEK